MRNMKDKLLNTVCIFPVLDLYEVLLRFSQMWCLRSLWLNLTFLYKADLDSVLDSKNLASGSLGVYKRWLSLSPNMGYYVDCYIETFTYMSLPLSWNVFTFTWDGFVSPPCLPSHQTSLYSGSLLCICTWPWIPFLVKGWDYKTQWEFLL